MVWVHGKTEPMKQRPGIRWSDCCECNHKNGSIDDIQIKEAKNEDSAYFNNAKNHRYNETKADSRC